MVGVVVFAAAVLLFLLLKFVAVLTMAIALAVRRATSSLEKANNAEVGVSAFAKPSRAKAIAVSTSIPAKNSGEDGMRRAPALATAGGRLR